MFLTVKTLSSAQTSRKREIGDETNSCTESLSFILEFLNDKSNVWIKVLKALTILK